MLERTVLAKEASTLVAEWAEKAIKPLCVPTTEALDFSLDPTCDQMLRAIADDPDGDLSVFPKPLLLLAFVRARWAFVAGNLEPMTPIVTIPADRPERQLLQFLIGGILAGTRCPPQWHREAARVIAESTHPGSFRKQ